VSPEREDGQDRQNLSHPVKVSYVEMARLGGTILADYYPLLSKAVAKLKPNNDRTRRQVFDRARAAITRQLHSYNPPLPMSEITGERLSLEQAVRRVEDEHRARAVAFENGRPLLQQEEDRKLKQSLQVIGRERPDKQFSALRMEVVNERLDLRISHEGEETVSGGIFGSLRICAEQAQAVFTTAANQHPETSRACSDYARVVQQDLQVLNPIEVWAIGVRLKWMVDRDQAARSDTSGSVETYDLRQTSALNALLALHGPFVQSFDEVKKISGLSDPSLSPAEAAALADKLDKVWQAIGSREIASTHTLRVSGLLSQTTRETRDPGALGTYSTLTRNAFIVITQIMVFTADRAAGGVLGDTAAKAFPALTEAMMDLVNSHGPILLALAGQWPERYGWLVHLVEFCRAFYRSRTE
jgi:hypothetical protein